jgi:hypothetical protein
MEKHNEPELDDQLKETEEDESDLPALDVWVNAGFGGGSHRCHINRCRAGEDSTMILPDALVKELRMESGDDLEWTLDEAGHYIYLSNGNTYPSLNSLHGRRRLRTNVY